MPVAPEGELPQRLVARSQLRHRLGGLPVEYSRQVEVDPGQAQPVVRHIYLVLIEVKLVLQSGLEIVPFHVFQDNTLFGGWFAKGSRSAAQRRRHFVRPENMEGHYFEPGLEYEFDFYQHQVDMTDYGLSLPGINLDLARVLDGQPPQAMAKLASRDEPLWEFSFWCDRH